MDGLDDSLNISLSALLSPGKLLELNKYERSYHGDIEQRDFFGLPLLVESLIRKYKGIESLYDWQKDCLQLEAVALRKNLVYSLPTSGGKTLVAEILMLRELILNKKNVLFILPYVALAQEKVRSLSPFGLDLEFYVEEYVGGKGKYPPVKHRKKRSVYICTIEKASGLVENLLQTNRLRAEIGMIVVDELHLVGEQSRGAILEAMLTQLLFVAEEIQIVGMSATIGNLEEIGKFLKAEVYRHDFRPIELKEFIKCDQNVYRIEKLNSKVSLQLDRTLDINYPREILNMDPSGVSILLSEVLPNDSCLIFCPTKNSCSQMSTLICKIMGSGLKDVKKKEKISLINAFLEEGQGVMCPILQNTLPYGVAYHHSGLTSAERKLLEEAYMLGTICCICCTSTLAAGVNLPAKRVIIYSPYVGRELMRLNTYKQMSGRCGRMGFTDIGHSYLICQSTQLNKVVELLESSTDDCKSCLHLYGLTNLIMKGIGMNMASNKIELVQLLKCSLFYIQVDNESCVERFIDESLMELTDIGALEINNESCYKLTDLANAAMVGNLNIKEAKILKKDLLDACKSGIILSNYLHLFYLITPYSALEEIKLNKEIVVGILSDMTESEVKVAERIGITQGCVYQFMKMGRVRSIEERIWNRFLLSLVIWGIWKTNSVWRVSAKFGIPRGNINSFLTRTATFASSVQRFTEALKIEELECIPSLLQNIIPRLLYCCTQELLQLMQLPSVKIGRAKQLYNAGFKTIKDVANVDPKLLISSIDHMPKRIANEIVAAAKLAMLEKVETLLEEAENLKEDLPTGEREIELSPVMTKRIKLVNSNINT